METVDLNLIKRFKQGSSEAFETVVKHYQQYAYRIAFGILGNERDAEDMVQEAFVTVYYRINSLKNEGAFPTWLAKIITNLCLRKIEANKKMPTVTLDLLDNRLNGDIHDAYQLFEIKNDVRKALMALPVELRTVLVLREFQGYSYNEIAEIADIPVGTVKSRIHTARLLLTEILQPAEKGGTKDEV